MRFEASLSRRSLIFGLRLGENLLYFSCCLFVLQEERCQFWVRSSAGTVFLPRRISFETFDVSGLPAGSFPISCSFEIAELLVPELRISPVPKPLSY